MRKRLAALFAVVMALGLVLTASASHIFWFQGFESDADGWLDSNTPGSYGEIERVSSGTNGISSADGGFHAIVNQVPLAEPNQHVSSGPFSRFDGYRTEWPGTWIAEIDVYLDPSWESGTAFDYSVAANRPDNAHRRDFIFHIESYGENDLRVGATNNSRWSAFPASPAQGNLSAANQVPTAGWYTLQHVFHDDGSGVLAVDMNLLDSDDSVLFTTTRSNAADIIGDTVGGNRYSWFTFSTVEDLAIDNHTLYLETSDPITKDDCMKGGFADFGFKNQGQCIQFVNTGKDSR